MRREEKKKYTNQWSVLFMSEPAYAFWSL